MGQPVLQGYKYAHINANGTTNIITSLSTPSGAPANPVGSLGLFAGVALNSPGTSWTITVYDGPNGTGNIIAVVSSTNATPPSNFPLQLTTGLSVVAAGSTPGSATVAYL